MSVMHHDCGHGERGTYLTCGAYACDLKDDTFTTIVRLVTCPECRRRMGLTEDRPTVGESAVRELAELREKLRALAEEYDWIRPDDLRRLLEE